MQSFEGILSDIYLNGDMQSRQQGRYGVAYAGGARSGRRGTGDSASTWIATTPNTSYLQRKHVEDIPSERASSARNNPTSQSMEVGNGLERKMRNKNEGLLGAETREPRTFPSAAKNSELSCDPMPHAQRNTWPEIRRLFPLQEDLEDDVG